MHRRPSLNRATGYGLTLCAALVLGLTAGCADGGDGGEIEAAPRADDPACRAVLAALPEQVADQPRAVAPVPGSATWGDPAIVLRCGLPTPGPTTTDCVSVNDVDWLVQERSDGFRFISYGRDPAVELNVPERYGRELASAALVDLADAVSPLSVRRRCT